MISISIPINRKKKNKNRLNEPNEFDMDSNICESQKKKVKIPSTVASNGRRSLSDVPLKSAIT